ncbi:MAG: hypothetical protein KF791_06460 [Verrucomicrobiae bacterium]|nr:hypothetical protein [Verrucomicrobiae bacterium]
MNPSPLLKQARCALLLAGSLAMTPATQAWVTPVFTNHFSQNPQPYPIPVTGYPDGTGARFGEVLAALGGGRFAVSAPRMDVLRSPAMARGFVGDAGFVWIYNESNGFGGSAAVAVHDLRRWHGLALAAFPDGRLLVGAANAAVTPAGITNELVGVVHLHDTDGTLLGTWPNPDGPANASGAFGWRVTALPGDRFAASSMSGSGKVFLFEATAVAPPLVVIPNPTPDPMGENFGQTLAAFGPDRLLIGDPGDRAVAGRRGSVMIYDLNGELHSTIANPVTTEPRTEADQLGAALLAVDDRRFLASAPAARTISYSQRLQQWTTNENAGAVYLLDDAGAVLATLVAPDVARSQFFGTSLALLGTNHVLIGCASEKINEVPAGAVHLFTLSGVHLGTVDNPAPSLNDEFGHAIAVVDDRRFVVGAPGDDALRTDAGSMYGYQVDDSFFTPPLLTGGVTISIEPPEAVADGAMWALADGPFQQSGASRPVDPGRYPLRFSELADWRGPSEMEVYVVGGNMTEVAVLFTRPPTYDFREVPEQHVRQGETLKLLVSGMDPGQPAQLLAEPPPAGALTFDPSTGRLTYTPGEADRLPFTLTFSVDGVPAGRTVVTPLPDLATEATLIRYHRPLPDPTSRDYISISETGNAPALFNDEIRTTLNVSISGMSLVFDAAHAAQLHQQYSGRHNIREFHLFADRVIIRSPLLLPQTRVAIHARELRFEGDGVINTTPRARTRIPAGAVWDDNRVAGLNGDPGHPGGDVDVLVERFYADPTLPIRFVLKGGTGGRPGEGRNGMFEGTAALFSPGLTTNETHVNWTNLMHRAGNVICGVDNGGIHFWEQVSTTAAGSTVLSTCGSQVPARGEPAVPSGIPGPGGNGGTLRSTVMNLLAYTQRSGGDPGARGNSYVGGDLFFPHFFRTSTFTTNPRTGEVTLRNGDTPAPRVRGADAPAPPGAPGEAGALALADPSAWLHSFSVRGVMQFARDAYLNGHDAAARGLLADYRDSIRTLHPDAVPIAGLDDAAAAEATRLDQAALEVDTLLHRMDSNLDYFGNPGGWVPMLSFEANLVAFEREVEQSIRILYLAYWLNRAATNLQDSLAASQSAVARLATELEDLAAAYNEAQLAIPQLKSESTSLNARIEAMQTRLLVLEFELLARAQQNVEERHKVPFWKKSLGVLAVLADLMPVGQPTLGRIGNGLERLSQVDPGAPLASLRANSTNVFALFSGKDISVCFANPATNAPGTNSAAARKAQTECAKFLGDQLKEMAKIFKEVQVDTKEVAAELEKLKASDPVFRDVSEELVRLNADKERFAQKLAETLQALATLTGAMTENVLATHHLEDRVAKTLTTLDHGALLHVREMEARAKNRLLQFQYYVAKSYQYRVLQPYSGNLQLNRLFDRFQALVEDGGGHVLSAAEFTSLKSLYLAELRETVAQTLQHLNANAPERSLPIQFQLNARELQQLNAEGSVVINLRRRGLFPSSHENIRIADLRTEAISARAVGGTIGTFALLFLDLEHRGVSHLTTGGQTFLFRHYQSATVNPITWNTVFDGLANAFSNSMLSPTTQSLLSVLLDQPTAGNLLLLSRPAADADILLRKQVQSDNGIDLAMDSLTLRLEYDFSTAGGARSRLDVAVTDNLEPVITVSQPDINGRRDGKGDFHRIFPTGTTVTLQSPPSYGARAFDRWVVNGQARPVGETLLALALTSSAVAEARFAPASVSEPGPDIVPPILSLSAGGAGLLGVDLTTAIGLRYTLEESPRLMNPVWTPVEVFIGDGGRRALLRPISTDPEVFYRMFVDVP